jgi:hypothetical protein
MNEIEMAKVYGDIHVRTVRRWKSEGGPVDDPTQMRTWLLTQKRIPSATFAWLTGKPKPKSRCVPPPRPLRRVGGDALHPRPVHVPAVKADADDTVRGAAAALKRLAEAELAANEAYLAALADPESTAEEVGDSRNAWVKLSESLRKFDLAVEIARRDSGALVPREIMEAYAAGLVVNFIGSVKASLEAAVPRLAGLPSPSLVWSVLGPVIDRAVTEAVKAVTDRPYKGSVAPPWLVNALNEALQAHV